MKLNFDLKFNISVGGDDSTITNTPTPPGIPQTLLPETFTVLTSQPVEHLYLPQSETTNQITKKTRWQQVEQIICTTVTVAIAAIIGIPGLSNLAERAVTDTVQYVQSSLTRSQQQSPNPNAVLKKASAWIGKEFRPNRSGQNAAFVRTIFREVGYELPITKKPIDNRRDRVSYLSANGLVGPDVGEVIDDRTDLKAGDILALANTHGNYPPGTVTEVGIYVGKGFFVYRGKDSKIQRQKFSAFQFAAGIRPRKINIGTNRVKGLLSTGDANLDAAIAAIRFGEGTLHSNGHRQLVYGGLTDDLSKHPFKDKPSKCAFIKGRRVCSTAAGTGQFLETTWNENAAPLNLTDFSEESQLRVMVRLLDESGAIAPIKEGKFDESLLYLCPIWASIPCFVGDTNGAYNQNVKPWNRLQDVYQKYGGT